MESSGRTEDESNDNADSCRSCRQFRSTLHECGIRGNILPPIIAPILTANGGVSQGQCQPVFSIRLSVVEGPTPPGWLGGGGMLDSDILCALNCGLL